jgi:hypothetical protein
VHEGDDGDGDANDTILASLDNDLVKRTVRKASASLALEIILVKIVIVFA